MAELAKFSRAKAAMLELAALRSKNVLRGRLAAREDQLKVVQRGLEGGRLQDTPYQAYLLAERAELHLRASTDPDVLVRTAYRDAEEVLRLASRGTIFPESKAKALGVAGVVRVYTSPRAGGRQRRQEEEEAVRKLRVAVALSPRYERAWEWKAFLAMALFNNTSEDPPGAQLVDKLEEACRLIAEADKESGKTGHDWLREKRREFESKSLAWFQYGVREHSQDPGAWRWHWRLAELQKDSRSAALGNIRKAESLAPATAPAEHRERMKTLRKELEGE
jgi:hypothetical protein